MWVVIPGRICSIPQAPAWRFQAVRLCVCVRVCVCMFLCGLGHEGSLFSHVCQFQSGPGEAGHHRQTVGGSIEKKKKKEEEEKMEEEEEEEEASSGSSASEIPVCI